MFLGILYSLGLDQIDANDLTKEIPVEANIEDIYWSKKLIKKYSEWFKYLSMKEFIILLFLKF